MEMFIIISKSLGFQIKRIKNTNNRYWAYHVGGSMLVTLEQFSALPNVDYIISLRNIIHLYPNQTPKENNDKSLKFYFGAFLLEEYADILPFSYHELRKRIYEHCNLKKREDIYKAIYNKTDNEEEYSMCLRLMNGG